MRHEKNFVEELWEIFLIVGVPTVRKFIAVIQQNFPWPEGLLKKSPPTSTSHLPVAPLQSACLAEVERRFLLATHTA